MCTREETFHTPLTEIYWTMLQKIQYSYYYYYYCYCYYMHQYTEQDRFLRHFYQNEFELIYLLHIAD